MSSLYRPDGSKAGSFLDAAAMGPSGYGTMISDTAPTLLTENPHHPFTVVVTGPDLELPVFITCASLDAARSLAFGIREHGYHATRAYLESQRSGARPSMRSSSTAGNVLSTLVGLLALPFVLAWALLRLMFTMWLVMLPIVIVLGIVAAIAGAFGAH